MKTFPACLLLLVSCFFSCSDQDPKPLVEDYKTASLESLKQALPNAPDTEKLDIYWNIYKKLDKKDTEKIRHYMDEMEALATELKAPEFRGKASFCKGLSYQFDQNYIEAMTNYEEALQPLKEIEHDQLLGIVKNNIANIYMESGDYKNSVEYFNKALSHYEKIGDKKRIGLSYGNLGLVNRKLSKHTLSLTYFDKAIEIYNEMSKTDDIALINNSIGALYFDQGEYAQARAYYEKAVPYIASIALNNIGETYLFEKNYNKAASILEKALVLREKEGIGNSHTIETLATLGQLYQETGEHEKAYGYFEQAIALATPTAYSATVKGVLQRIPVSQSEILKNGLRIDPTKVAEYPQLLAEQYELEAALNKRLNPDAIAMAHLKKIEENKYKTNQEAALLKYKTLGVVSILLLMLAMGFYLGYRQAANKNNKAIKWMVDNGLV